MTTRRTLLTAAMAGVAALAAGPIAARIDAPLPANRTGGGRYRPPGRLGMGGVALGNGFAPATDEETFGAVQAAWDAGVRYFDTSPWYGLGLSERRFGAVLHDKPRDQFVLSTKVGRLLRPDPVAAGRDLATWRKIPPFRHEYDYSAAGIRRSIEDSLQRLGMAQLDIVFIHDISPDNGDMGPRWTEYFAQAREGAMLELTRMREEGLIKAWGLGVNTLEPALAAFEAADPDIILSATQYSLIKHEDALNRLFPVARRRGASIIVGAPLNAGFLAGRDRYDYRGQMPAGALEKRARMAAIAERHGTDLRTAALHFANANPTVAAIIPGARNARQATENAASMRTAIAPAFWAELKSERLIAADAPVPA
ncbi:L-fucose dehydrogenase [Sphingomonas oleivorans]|uniref:L-fucose dehydrogenase n=1 Tax=Sphingomonas oleivorans TaxID=1735121 RepID=A0A2T5FUR4_9SPHN|nr:aldo/keto reductase [Sphingomonas oleivorans]PTQ08246.1 L-fucose dehydrogenase [Sphingomonas oleivorans]